MHSDPSSILSKAVYILHWTKISRIDLNSPIHPPAKGKSPTIEGSKT